MFGRKKEPEPAERPVYVVKKGNKKLGVQRMLNEMHADGYDLVTVTVEEGFGSSLSANYIFKLRDAN